MENGRRVDGHMGIELHDCQTTLKSRISLSGIGVHSGLPVTVHFNPADPDTGVVFPVSYTHLTLPTNREV